MLLCFIHVFFILNEFYRIRSSRLKPNIFIPVYLIICFILVSLLILKNNTLSRRSVHFYDGNAHSSHSIFLNNIITFAYVHHFECCMEEKLTKWIYCWIIDSFGYTNYYSGFKVARSLANNLIFCLRWKSKDRNYVCWKVQYIYVQRRLIGPK